ncbi:hypothetical protein [Reyranella massiliensis]|uniref:hypothetical protein n=1 Tax=Reyranella massiliensis TaxID=445220 RepID=UPI00031DCE78|nr:hypothetical protein [Reyranella massiliensis]
MFGVAQQVLYRYSVNPGCTGVDRRVSVDPGSMRCPLHQSFRQPKYGSAVNDYYLVAVLKFRG